jgi:hypothetical protein
VRYAWADAHLISGGGVQVDFLHRALLDETGDDELDGVHEVGAVPILFVLLAVRLGIESNHAFVRFGNQGQERQRDLARRAERSSGRERRGRGDGSARRRRREPRALLLQVLHREPEVEGL